MHGPVLSHPQQKTECFQYQMAPRAPTGDHNSDLYQHRLVFLFNFKILNDFGLTKTFHISFTKIFQI